MTTVLGMAVHVVQRAADQAAGSSLTEIAGIVGAALALAVLWIGTRFLPRAAKQPAVTVTRPRLGELRSASRLTTPRPAQGVRGRPTRVVP